MSEPRDLDAAVAAKLGEPKSYVLAGREFTLPARIPLAAAAAIHKQDFDRLAVILAGGDVDLADHFLTHLTDAHLEAIGEDYGVPNSAASAG